MNFLEWLILVAIISPQMIALKDILKELGLPPGLRLAFSLFSLKFLVKLGFVASTVLASFHTFVKWVILHHYVLPLPN